MVVEVDNSVAIRERLSFDTVVEDDLFLAVLIDALDLAIMAHILFDNFLIWQRFVVVLLRELQAEVFLFIRLTHARQVLRTLLMFVIHFTFRVLVMTLVVLIVLRGTSTVDHVGDSTSTVRQAAEVVIDLVSLFVLQVLLVFIVPVVKVPLAVAVVHLAWQFLLLIVRVVLMILLILLVVLSEEHLVLHVILRVLASVGSALTPAECIPTLLLV